VSTRSGAVALIIAAFAATTPARAQRVRGTLKDSVTNEPVIGAVVITSDSAGAFLARTISDEAGQFNVFRLRGAAKLHVVRIGFRPADASIPATDDSIAIRLAPIASLLRAVSSSSKRVCPGEKGNADALDLWEQARAGLLAGVAAREARPPRIRLRSFIRTYEPVRRRLVDQSADVKDVDESRSYVAARPAWAFASEGYMRENVDGSREYYAPDDFVLLDPSFAETHCLRVTAGDAAHASQIGIAFEPADGAGRDTLVEITGVLWMDQVHPALRSLEFHYTNLESYAKGSGGEIHFAVMPNGAPLIDRWTIHSAILATDEEDAPVKRRPSPRPMRTNVRLLGRQDFGGEVVAVEWSDGTHWGGSFAGVAGVVVDLTGARVSGARVWVRGTKDTATSKADGTFELPYLRPGKYVIVASDSTLAATGTPRTVPREIELFTQGTALKDVWLTVHPRSEVLSLMCPAKSYRPGTAVLVATITTSSGMPAAAAHVEVEITEPTATGDSVHRLQTSSGDAGPDGRFVVCGASLNQTLVIHASNGPETAAMTVDAWKDDVMAATLVLKPRQP